MTDQPATGPRTLTVHWHPDAVHDAIAGAQAAIQTTDPDQPVQLSWQEAACLLDMARAWMSAQEAAQPTELREVPNVSPAEFEAFKTRWIEQHAKDALGGVPVEEATRNWEANKHLLRDDGYALNVEEKSFNDDYVPVDTLIDWHAYRPTLNVSVMICADCGKWPGHHNHQGITPELCSCDAHTSDDADGRSP